MEPLQGQLLRFYDLNFEAYAAVMRNARIHLGQPQIDTMYSLKVVYAYMVQELKRINEMFNEAKFIQAINAER